MEHWSEALRITAAGLGVVFGVMAIIAVATWASGRVFVALERREKARKKEAEAEKRDDEPESDGGGKRSGRGSASPAGPAGGGT